MRPRFYAPAIDEGQGRAELTGDEAGHLVRVLRLGIGAEVDVFDGRGRAWVASVVEADRRRILLRLLRPAAVASEPRINVSLASSVLKGDKMDAVVRDATMMGISALYPILAGRSEVPVGSAGRRGRVDRWRRIAVSSVKQCGRAIVPAIHEPLTLPEWLALRLGQPALVLVEPSAGAGRALSELEPSPSAALLVGPEGGWAKDELAAIAAAGAVPIALGPRTLRAEAAPVVALAALYEAWRVW